MKQIEVAVSRTIDQIAHITVYVSDDAEWDDVEKAANEHIATSDVDWDTISEGDREFEPGCDSADEIYEKGFA